MAKFYNSDIDIKSIDMGKTFVFNAEEAIRILEEYNKNKFVKITFKFVPFHTNTHRYIGISEDDVLTINALNQFQLHIEL